MIKRMIPNYDFIKNMSNDLFDEFVNTPDGLPYDLLDFVSEIVPEINFIRSAARVNHPELEGVDSEERAIAYKMRSKPGYKIEDALNFHTQYALDFLEKYPQFKPMIKGVKEVG